MGFLLRPRGVFALASRTLAVCLSLALASPPPAAFAAAREARSNFKYEDLAAPALLAPSRAIDTTAPVFTWTPVAGASSYEFEVVREGGQPLYRRDGVKSTTFSLPGEGRLTFGQAYAWRVRAFDHPTHRASPWSAAVAFSCTSSRPDAPPIARASATPASGEAPLAVTLGGSASTDAEGALTFAWDFDGDAATDSAEVSARHTYATPGTHTARLVVTDSSGQTDTATARVVVTLPAPTVTLSVAPADVLAGDVVLLAWDSSWAESVVISPGIGPVPPSGTLAVTPLADTTYVATAANATGEASASASVRVNTPPIAAAAVSPASGPAPLPAVLDASASSDPDGGTLTYAWDIDADGSAESTSVSFEHLFEHRGTYTALLIVTDERGASATASVAVRATSPLPLAAASVSPSHILAGESALLSWTGTNAETVWIEPGIGPVAASGAVAVAPADDVTYTVTVANESGTSSVAVPLSVNIAPHANATAEPAEGVGPLHVVFDASASADADGRIASYAWDLDGDGATDATGVSAETTYAAPGTYPARLTVTDEEGGTDTALVPVTVRHPAPTLELSADATRILTGDTVLLSWTSEHADSVLVSLGTGPVAASGTLALTPLADTTYTVTASGPGGTLTRELPVHVLAIATPPSGTFADAYSDCVADDATVTAFDMQRFAVVVGRVTDTDGAPMAGVTVTLPGRSGYGSAVTDAQGAYRIAVDGGGTVRVCFEREGYLTAERGVTVPWNDIAVTDDVMLTRVDASSTVITLDGDPGSRFAHTGAEVADARGERAVTLVFAGDTAAVLTRSDGTTVTADRIEVRATEFTTPSALPAALPAPSAFTYCVELSVDGATSVAFSKPVALWIDDFVGFGPGVIVPVGYFDRGRGMWIPERDGITVAIIDTDGDGVPEGADVNSDGIADDLDADGTPGNETAGLPTHRFENGDVAWYVRIAHFSAVDCNWLERMFLPPGSTVPTMGECPRPEGSCKEKANSAVSPGNGALHDDIPIVGTGITLHYSSDRASGYRARFDVPVSAGTGALGRVVDVTIAGQRLAVSDFTGTGGLAGASDPAIAGVTGFLWDGLDARGKPVKGRAKAHVEVRYRYQLYYRSMRDAYRLGDPGAPYTVTLSSASFGSRVLPAEYAETMVPAKFFTADYTLAYDVDIVRPASPGGIAEGWAISADAAVVRDDPTRLHTGTGDVVQRPQTMLRSAPMRMAGPGSLVVYDLASTPDGGAWIASQFGQWQGLARVDKAGNATKVVSSPISTVQEDLLTAASDGAGRGYLASHQRGRVVRVDSDGTTACIAGNGQPFPGTFAEGVPATSVSMDPQDIAADDAGNVYVIDQPWNTAPRVREISAAGIVRTLPFPAWARKVACTRDGTVFAAVGARVWRMGPDGTAVHVAGSTSENAPLPYASNNALDGYDAKSVNCAASDIAVDASGHLLILQASNAGLIWRVEDDGRLKVLAGTKDVSAGFAANVPATTAKLYYPRLGMSVDPAGGVVLGTGFRISSGRDDAAPRAAISSFTLDPRTELGFDGQGRVTRVVERPSGRVRTSFARDTFGNLTAISDDLGGGVTFLRDSTGRVTSVVTTDGDVTELSYDGQGHLTRVSYPDGGAYRMTYAAGGLLADVTDPAGYTASHTYEDGRIVSATSTDSTGFTYSREVNTSGVLTMTTTTGAGTTRSVTRSLTGGTSTSTTRNSRGAPTVTRTWADGMRSSTTLLNGTVIESASGWDTAFAMKVPSSRSVKVPSGLTRSESYSRTYENLTLDGRYSAIVERSTVNDRVTTARDDVLAGVRTLTSPSGRTATGTYDVATGLPRSLAAPGMLPVTYAQDSRGRTTGVAQGERSAGFAYDARGDMTTLTAADGAVTSMEYDAMHRPVAVTRADGTEMAYRYDAAGNMTALVTPAGATHNFASDSSGARTSWATPLSGSYAYSYDGAGRPVSVTSPSGSTASFGYTGDGLTSLSFPGGEIRYVRPICDRLNGTIRGSETSTLTYDGILVTREVRRGSVDATLTWGYDTDLRPTSFGYAGGTQAYTYDADSLLTAAAPFTISREAASGLPVSVTAPGFALTRTFSGFGEIDSAASSAYGYTLTRDAAGRITSKQEGSSDGTHTWGYAYDTLGRLVTATRDGQLAESYAWDAAGNRTATRAPIRGVDSTLSATFDAEDHGLVVGDVAYTFTEDGYLASRTTSAGVTSYRYSALGELERVELADGRVIRYAYDGAGRRVSKAVDGSIVERYLWADATRLLATYDASGTLTARYLYADARTPYAVDTPAGRYFLSFDQVGSLRAVTDTSGAVVRRLEHDSFGNTVSDTAPGLVTPLGFAGGLTDADTGLVLFGARDYDPALGRWCAKDPIGFAGGDANLYAYCIGDPVGLADPAGLWTVSGGLGWQAGLFTLGGSGSRTIAWDGRKFADYLTNGPMGQVPFSNWITATSRSAGAGEASAGFTGAWTTAPSVECLQGPSERAGVSFGPFPFSASVDVVWAERYWGVQVAGGIGAHTPVSAHYLREDSTFLPPTNRDISVVTPTAPVPYDSYGSMRSRDY